MAVVSPGSAPITLNGYGVVLNSGPGTVYYDDDQYVSPTQSSGSLQPGQSVPINGAMWFVATNSAANVGVINAPPGGPLTVSDTTANAAAHQFTLSPREDPALAFGVPTVRSSTPASQTAFDVMPNGSPAAGGNGYAWMDVCDTDGLVGTYVGSTARVGIHSDHVEFSSRGVGATAKRIDMSANMINNNQIPQIQINPGNSTLSSNFPTAPGNIQLAKDGSDLYLGRIASTLTAAATVGHTYLRMVTAPPTGVPAGVLSGSAAIAVDSTGKIWVYTSANAAWKSVATA